MLQHTKSKLRIICAALLLLLNVLIIAPPVYAAPHECGHGDGAYTPSIDLGCNGQADNPIVDVTFGIIRFLSNGVGLVIIASIIWGGIQYSVSRGDPQATAKAMHRIQSTVIALIIYVFSYALLNYVLPAGFVR